MVLHTHSGFTDPLLLLKECLQLQVTEDSTQLTYKSSSFLFSCNKAYRGKELPMLLSLQALPSTILNLLAAHLISTGQLVLYRASRWNFRREKRGRMTAYTNHFSLYIRKAKVFTGIPLIQLIKGFLLISHWL